MDSNPNTQPITESEQDDTIMFEIRYKGQNVSMTKRQLFDRARRGFVLPDTLVTFAGTKVFADEIRGIVFGQPPSEPTLPSSAVSPVSIAPRPAALDHGTDDLFNMKGEPIVRVVRPLRTEPSVISEIGEKLGASLNRVPLSVQENFVLRYLKPFGYVCGVICFLGILGFFVFGRTKSPDGIIYLTGMVTLDGQPVNGVSVVLHPRNDGGAVAGGLTNTKGKFTVTTGTAPVGSGAKAGEYDITFSKVEVEKSDTAHNRTQIPAQKTYIIPAKYGKPKTSGLAPITVELNGKNRFDFALSSEPIQNDHIIEPTPPQPQPPKPVIPGTEPKPPSPPPPPWEQKLYPAQIKVTANDGEKLEEAFVVLLSSRSLIEGWREGERTIIVAGVTDAKGIAELHELPGYETGHGFGVPAGKYKVCVGWDVDLNAAVSDGGIVLKGKQGKPALEGQYMDIRKTPLEVEIGEGKYRLSVEVKKVETSPPPPKPPSPEPVVSPSPPKPPKQPVPTLTKEKDIFDAAGKGTVNDVQKCLEKGEKIDKKASDGGTPLHRAAAENSRVEVIKYLISQGADVNAKDETGYTPLHVAVLLNNNLEVLKCLIESGADLRAKNRSGHTPRDIAPNGQKEYFLRKAEEAAKRKK